MAEGTPVRASAGQREQSQRAAERALNSGSLDLSALTGQMAEALSPSFPELHARGATGSVQLSLEVLMGTGHVQYVLDEVESSLSADKVGVCSARLNWAMERLKGLQREAEAAEAAERCGASSPDGQQRCLAVFAALGAAVERRARLQAQLAQRLQVSARPKPAPVLAAEYLNPESSLCIMGRKDACNELLNDLFAEEFKLAMEGMERWLLPVSKLMDIISPAQRKTEFSNGSASGMKPYMHGYADYGPGIFCCEPKSCQGARYRESIAMGTTSMSEEEVERLVDDMDSQWSGTEYDLLRKNCCSFSNAFCLELGVGPIPSWVTNLAAAGATLGDGIIKAASVGHSAAIIAAAKAGEINAKYQIAGTAQARAQDFLAAMQGLNRQYRIRQSVQGIAATVALQADELDRQYGIRRKAQGVASTVTTQARQIDRQFRIQEAVEGAAAQVTSAVQSLARQSLAASQASSRPRPSRPSASLPEGNGAECVCS